MKSLHIKVEVRDRWGIFKLDCLQEQTDENNSY